MADQQLKINLTPERAEGKYANLAIIAHSATEFILDFAQMMPSGQNAPTANVVSRVIVTPDQAKKILSALQHNIAQYEKQFGEITLNNGPVPGSTLPLSFGGGEA